MAYPTPRASQKVRHQEVRDMRSANQKHQPGDQKRQPAEERARVWREPRSNAAIEGGLPQIRQRTVVIYPAKSRVKRALDLVAGSLMLVALLPVMMIIAALVKRDGGPVLFRHQRIGANGKPFHCLKFRTM